jgi:hypothetical protein
MSKSDAQERYDRILADAAQSDTQQRRAGGEERRGAARVSVVSGEMAVNMQVPVSPVDLSTTGACFFAERPFPAGTPIEISVASVFTVTATVVDCTMEETGSDFLEVHYRVRARFEDPERGMELLVAAKDREHLI